MNELVRKKIIWILEMPIMSMAFNMQVWKIKKQLFEGCEIDIVLCDSSIRRCYVNPMGLKKICSGCNLHVKNTFKSMKVNLLEFPSHLNGMEKKDASEFRAWGSKSTFISSFRTFPDDIKSRALKKIFQDFFLSSFKFYNYLQNFLMLKKYDELWTFNGRLNLSNAAIQVATSNNLNYSIFELMGRDYQVSIRKNTSNFDPEILGKNFRNYINKFSRKEFSKGAGFFEGKLRGEWTNDRPYFIPSHNSSNFEKKIDILFLFSSEDEYAALEDNWINFFKKQEEVCCYVKEKFPNLTVAVRFHPNQSDINKKILEKKIEELKKASLCVFPPNSNFSSYDLLRNSELIFTFGSTIGIEAVYQQKKVISLGKNYYSGLSIMLQVNSYQELDKVLNPSFVVPVRKYRALMFGFFALNYSDEVCDQAYISDYLEYQESFFANFGFNINRKFSNFLVRILSDRPLNLRLRFKNLIKNNILWAINDK
jgi:hypothetical protein